MKAGTNKNGVSFGLEQGDINTHSQITGYGVQVSIIDTEYMNTQYNAFRLGKLGYSGQWYNTNIKYIKMTNTLFWYNEYADLQFNQKGTTYYWIIF